ncbi:MAG: penicillin-binding transpeptidase domain-containing protein, partial [Bacillus sp. (in: Bacteria)]|nr:penicillin-binding transpeptidase domain-containing protein [Bacillus sp. (in: firmicutes)]
LEILGPKWQKDKSWGGYFVTRVHEASPINLEKAFVFSDNIYFAQAALKTGKEAFLSGLKKFGFEEESTYPFPLEKSMIGGLDNDIALADSGYGQGQIQMSVVHLLASYTPFVNNGNMIKPILLADEQQAQVQSAAIVTSEQAGLIAADLRKVVGDAGGSGHGANMADFPLSGKTGTAEIKQKQGETGTENGWFIAYNTTNPSLMIALMVENVQGRGGSQVPVTKVKNIYMQRK